MLVAAAALVAIVLVTQDRSSGTPVPTDRPLPTASPLFGVVPTPDPTSTLTTSAPPEPPSRDPIATPFPAIDPVPVQAGPVELTPAGAPSIRVTVSVPDGWALAGGATLIRRGSADAPAVAIGAWVIEDVFIYPCRWASDEVVDTALMHSADGQAAALAAWWGQDPGKPPNSNALIAPIANRPTLGSIAGRNAWFVDVLIRREFDFSACDGGQLVLWRAGTGAVRSTTEQGQLHRLWALDIDGIVLVIDATSSTAASIDDQTALLRVISSMVIEPQPR